MDSKLNWTAVGSNINTPSGCKVATCGATTFSIVKAHARAPFSLYYQVGDMFQLVGQYGSEWDASLQAEVIAAHLQEVK